jgi:hypothetical protein
MAPDISRFRVGFAKPQKKSRFARPDGGQVKVAR